MESRKELLLKKYSENGNTKMPGGMMGPGPGGRGGKNRGPMKLEKGKNTSQSIKRVFSYISQDKMKLLFVLLCAIISTVSSLGGSYVLRPVINNLVDKNTTKSEKVEMLILGLIVMGAIYMAGVVTSYIQQKVMIKISQNAIQRIRNDLFDKLQRLPVKYHDTHTHGELMSRFTNDLDSVGEMLNNTLVHLFTGVITIIGTLILMFTTNWILAIVVIITIPFMTLAGGAVGSKSRKYYGGQQRALGAVNGYIEEMVTGQKVVKVFCHEDEAVRDFEILSDELRANQVNAQFFGGIMGPVMNGLSQISYTITGVVGGILCLTRGFDIGGLTVFTQYSKQFARPVNEISMQVNTIFSALAGAERVFAVMDEPMEDKHKQLKKLYTKEEYDKLSENEKADENNVLIHGDVELKNVTFGYVPDKKVLKNIDVFARPGQQVAFVGSTGAGKTTITNLINRFYDIDEGQITIDGIDVKDIDKDSLRGHIAMVLQDTHLFTGTVRENIRYGRLDATDEEVEAAAKTASAHSFIKRLANGYDTIIEGDGANLSQGQRQLLNIARAAISKAPMLILDEATSSVDTRTEKHIQHGMNRLMNDRTTFVIAHRLSTVRNVDCIMVLEQGEIIERGTHDELLLKKGRYYQLYTGAVELD
ncbi:MAG: ABC transporter ATP-binding protein [Lachnospiraceae bacterium]|nr:ABC transporter ATP-binding protein [Lachnospiraceae bacterium]